MRSAWSEYYSAPEISERERHGFEVCVCGFECVRSNLLQSEQIYYDCGVCVCCSSEEWNKVSKSEREKLGVTVQDDGEFW